MRVNWNWKQIFKNNNKDGWDLWFFIYEHVTVIRDTWLLKTITSEIVVFCHVHLHHEVFPISERIIRF